MSDLKQQYYGNDTLEETVGERNQVRTRPQVYFGTNDVKGCMHGVLEIVTNGADELSSGHGSTIRTIIEEDMDAIRSGDVDGSYIVTVIDDGRGVPMDINPKNGKYNWHLVYNQLFASGKRGSSGAYAGAAGLNGVGAAITQFTSVWMKVISRRKELMSDGRVENIEYEMNFSDGEPVGQLIKRPWTTGDENITGLTGTGTYVSYKTDPRFFLQVRYSFEMIADAIRKLATVADGQKYYLRFLDEEPITFCYEHGITDFLNAIITEPIMKESFRHVGAEKVQDVFMGEHVEYSVGVNCAFSFSNNQGYIETFHNSSYTPENGQQYNGARDAIREVLEKFGQREGKLAAKEKILVGDLEDMLCIICASSMDKGEYCAWSGQDKRAINNDRVYDVVKRQITESFRNWLTTHREDGLKVIQAIKLRKEAREKADQIKKKLVKQMTTSPNELKSRPAKLHDCSSRDTTENELFIVEGDSAEGSTITARNVQTQATYPLTGVILNCEKARPEQILGNRVIRELIQIFGCGIEIPTENKHMAKVLKDLPKFDARKLNYGKIVFLTDADLDGHHISCLLIVFVAKLMPELLRQGRIYLAQAPLFKVEFNDNTYEYVYTEGELKQKLEQYKQYGIKVKYIKRFKGLGEMQPDELAESVMEPKTRRLIPVEFNDEEGFHQIMQDLLGDNLDERKAYIREFFEMVTDAEQEAENEYLLEMAANGEF